MSRHEGVSCDSCLKGNFRGRRYKCLICYDYDLCPACYEAGATNTRHTTEHPMQCILTRTDFDLYYGGETLTAEQPQAFTCPFCGRMGFTEPKLEEHVTADHADTSSEVVCPVCAAFPGGDPNHVTDDFAAHLTLEHRTPRDFEETGGGIRHVRRIPHPGRGVGGSRARRTNMHFQPTSSGLSVLSPSARDTMDPIAELLSQLSSARSRAAAAQTVSSQLQQLEMQLQSTRQQLERTTRRPTEVTKPVTSTSGPSAVGSGLAEYATVVASSTVAVASATQANSQFLLSRCVEPDLTEQEKQAAEAERADRGIFVQELLLSTLAEGLRLDDRPSSAGSSSVVSLDDGGDGVQPPPTPDQPQDPPTQAQQSPPLQQRAAEANSGEQNLSHNSSIGGSHVGGGGHMTFPVSGVVGQPASQNMKPVHRNMVKHLELNRKAEREPPPAGAKHK
eukprot:GHVU01075442.1.p1 GENE.GHVU01075442.1~~GHVU01075442.1.p1  ORF type:complete len:448 (+),score=21.87 GHVU01075442.1:182-1525(+)